MSADRIYDRLPPSAQWRVEADARALAKEVDAAPERVRRILARTMFDPSGHSLTSRLVDPLTPPWNLESRPNLAEALGVLPVEIALELFEREDLDLLGQRADLTRYLGDADTPLHTRAELADLIDQLALHLQQQREALLRTGYPSPDFTPSSWLEWKLGALYFVTPFAGWDIQSKSSGEAPSILWSVLDDWVSGLNDSEERRPASRTGRRRHRDPSVRDAK